MIKPLSEKELKTLYKVFMALDNGNSRALARHLQKLYSLRGYDVTLSEIKCAIVQKERCAEPLEELLSWSGEEIKSYVA